MSMPIAVLLLLRLVSEEPVSVRVIVGCSLGEQHITLHGLSILFGSPIRSALTPLLKLIEQAREIVFSQLGMIGKHFFCLLLQHVQPRRDTYDTLPSILPLQKHATMRPLRTSEHILSESRRRKHRQQTFRLRST